MLLLQLAFAFLLATVPATVPDPSETTEHLDAPERGRFVYLDGGGTVTLRASSMYAAAVAPRTVERGGLAVPPEGLELDPRSSRSDLRARGVTLFRVPAVVAPRGLELPPLPDAWRSTLASGLPAQPVFEKGAALRIPSDEVVVAFDPSTTREQAKRLLSDKWDDIEASALIELRPGIFVCVLEDAAVGRAFPVSRVVSEIEGVLWAEPVFINIYLETPGGPPAIPPVPFDAEFISHKQTIEARPGGSPVWRKDFHPEGDEWQLLLNGHFEGNVDRWTVGRDAGSNRILPWVTRDRAHQGNRSVHMSGRGLNGNQPPDPYGSGAGSWLISPPFSPEPYTRVFVEMWFWAELEDPQDAPRQVYDFGHVLLYDVDNEEFVYEYPIVPAGPTGDLAEAPGTDHGWRKLLFRVPDLRRLHPLQLLVHFYSDGLRGAEGLYIDDIRVLGTSGLIRPPASQDVLVDAQYTVSPLRQIAARPEKDDPQVDGAAAWRLVFSRRDVVVALLDDGVDRAHPDLAFWEPVRDRVIRRAEEEDETTGPAPDIDAPAESKPVRSSDADDIELYPGDPVSPDDRHGTACAGVLGAIANNDVGTAGSAPGALLLPLHRGLDDVSIVRAIDAAVDHGAHVLVIPWGWTDAGPALVERVILDAIEDGMIVVAAAGDGVHRPYSDEIDFPCSLGASTSLLCVGASGIAGQPKGPATEDGLYWWASAASAAGPDLLAPGTWLHTSDLPGSLGYNDGSDTLDSRYTDGFGGTGAAACYAAGVTSLMLSRDPLMSPEEAKRLITGTATRLPVATSKRDEFRLVAPRAAVLAAIQQALARENEETADR